MLKIIKAVQYVLLAAVAVWLVFGAADASAGSSEESRRLTEQSLRRAAVACYSQEGFYPSDYRYLTDNYGVREPDGVIIHYAATAPNLMPQIIVFAEGEG